MEHLLARLRAHRRRHPRLGVGVRGVHRRWSCPSAPAVAAPSEPASEHPAAAHAPSPSASPRSCPRSIRDQQPLVARADGRRAADKELAERGIRSAHGEPLIRRRRGRSASSPSSRPPPPPRTCSARPTPKLAAALAEAWTRRSETAPDGAGRGAARPDRVRRRRPQSMDQLLGAACRQLAELGEVERACIFLLEDGRPRPADGRLRRRPPRPRHLGAVPQRPGRPAAHRDRAAHRRADGRRPGLRAAVRLVGRQLRRRLRPRRPARPQPAPGRGAHPRQHARCGRSPRTCGGSPPPPAPTSAASSSRPGPARPAQPR